MEWWMYLAGGVVILALGLLIGYAYRKNVAEAKVAKAEDAVKQLFEEAKLKAADIKKEMVLEAKEEAFKTRSEAERENREPAGGTAAHGAPAVPARGIARQKDGGA